MNKSELVREMAEATNLTIKSTEAALDALINSITKVLSQENKLTLVGFLVRLKYPSVLLELAAIQKLEKRLIF